MIMIIICFFCKKNESINYIFYPKIKSCRGYCKKCYETIIRKDTGELIFDMVKITKNQYLKYAVLQ